MLGREIVEGQQGLPVLLQTSHRLRVLGLVRLDKMVEGLVGRGPVLGHPDLLQGLLCPGLNGLRQVVQHVRHLVHPAALMTGPGIHFIPCRPEAKSAVSHRQLRRPFEATLLQVPQHLPPAPGRFPDAILDGQNMLLAPFIDTDDHQGAQLLALVPQAAVDAVHPPIDPPIPAHLPSAPFGLFRFPLPFQTTHHRGRQPFHLGADQHFQGLLHPAGRDALQVQPWQGCLHPTGLPHVGRHSQIQSLP